ncbi:hypothetical protein VCRA2123O444_40176 [Vibrio crassostreae]|nr:hypothetical protein VCRA2113O409_50052 [Vibrio crassostreae]CAK2122854.1 hypothetical protein VCRA2113O412_50051 [Vibrio crassostreae]CAK2123882.1 hypothetical protein VCRA2113O414_50051 [Vibrio crassostreae]CAK2133951.1 hypothetical protein VCRA2118O429_60051 [Vibrio crassostreae]CAK2142303.1 hypothetical protein VCRA2114O421_60051 [Vibrio crassostreae]
MLVVSDDVENHKDNNQKFESAEKQFSFALKAIKLTLKSS